MQSKLVRSSTGIGPDKWSDFTLLLAPVLFVSFSVSIDERMNLIQLGMLAISLVIYQFTAYHRSSRYIDKGLFVIALLFVFPWITGTSLGLFFTSRGQNGEVLAAIEPWGRLINIALLTWYILSICSRTDDMSRIGLALSRTYMYGCIILLVFAIWQALEFYTSFPIPFPFDTRSYMHSQGGLDIDITNRITGYAAEPSYIAPFLVDGLILSLFMIKRKMMRWAVVSIFFLVLTLTFSPSGYISILSVLVVWGWIKYKEKPLLLPGVIIIGMILASFIYSSDIIQYFLLRVGQYEDSGRFQGVWEPVKFILEEGSFGNLLFGFGTKAMQSFYELNYQGFEFSTANNLFTDILFETGLLGLGCYIALFLVLFKYSLEVSDDNALPLYLVTNLLVSSLYRSDFASLRFSALICIIYCTYKGYRRRKQQIINSVSYNNNSGNNRTSDCPTIIKTNHEPVTYS